MLFYSCLLLLLVNWWIFHLRISNSAPVFRSVYLRIETSEQRASWPEVQVCVPERTRHCGPTAGSILTQFGMHSELNPEFHRWGKRRRRYNIDQLFLKLVFFFAKLLLGLGLYFPWNQLWSAFTHPTECWMDSLMLWMGHLGLNIIKCMKCAHAAWSFKHKNQC